MPTPVIKPLLMETLLNLSWEENTGMPTTLQHISSNMVPLDLRLTLVSLSMVEVSKYLLDLLQDHSNQLLVV
jgi:hypothetical protein